MNCLPKFKLTKYSLIDGTKMRCAWIQVKDRVIFAHHWIRSGQQVAKRRILFCGESSWLSTGFATYNREIIQRLYDTDKYIIAEMGAYGSEAMPEAQKIPWKFYGVLPRNEEENRIYNSGPGGTVNQLHAFGKYKIDAVVADFQPDIVFDCRDPWMTQHLQDSKFRDCYKLVLMPTVDSAPQRKDWINKLFAKSDALLTYSQYGKKVLTEAGLKVNDVPSPGVHLDKFKPQTRSLSEISINLNHRFLLLVR